MKGTQVCSRLIFATYQHSVDLHRMKKQGAFIFLDAASTAAAAAAVFNPPHPVYQAIRMNTSSTVNITCLVILTVTIEK